MSPWLKTLVEFATYLTFFNLATAMFFSALLMVRGPGLPTRVLALVLIANVFAAIATTSSIFNHRPTYLDTAVTICLIDFLSTLAYARYIQHRKRARKGEPQNVD